MQLSSHPSGKVDNELIVVPYGLVLNSGEDIDVCKCMSLQYGDNLNSRLAESPTIRLVKEDERWVAFLGLLS
ncbi:hypothetical protein TNCV_4177981 [Trichonephila clavipes]|nr:hypothetical protein TNCV_4177981 [Trichonephila clavipes]